MEETHAHCTIAVPWMLIVCDGVVNPVGWVSMLMVELPAATGWKLVAAELEPTAKTTGLVVIVPTGVLELVTASENGLAPGLMGKP